MTRHERLTALLGLLAERERIEVDDAATALGVSPATIRRDLDHLAEQQLLVRTHGGAIAGNVAYDLPLRYKTARRAAEKQRIADVAAGLVGPGAVLGMNGGTTTTEVARAVAVRSDAAAGGASEVTVVTNALNIAADLTVRPHIKVVVTGGVARHQSYELIGPLVGRVLDELTLDLVFLGVDALHSRHGASAHHEGEANINRLMAAHARQVVVVADSSKLDKRAFARICRVPEMHTVITDAGAPDDVVARFEEQGVRVLRA
jgi:DeoR family transcriptional regulator of aga operon